MPSAKKRFMLKSFGGMNIDAGPTTLLDDEAQVAIECRLTQSGALRPQFGRSLHGTAATGTGIISGACGYGGYGLGSYWATSNNRIVMFETDTGDIYTDHTLSGTLTLVGSSYTADMPFWHTNANDGMYILNGKDTPAVLRYGETYDITQWGIPAPTFTTASALAAGGAVDDGDHYYKVVYYASNAVSSYEGWSNPNAAKLVTTGAGNNTVNLSGMTASSHGRITHKKIYRTLAGTASTSVYYLVATITNATTTYSDVSSDATILGNAVLETDNYVCPTAYYSCLHLGRMFVARSDTYPNRVWWSKLPSVMGSRYDNFPSADEYHDVGDAVDPIMGIVASYDGSTILILKKYSVWQMSGSTIEDIDSALLFPTGVLSSQTICTDGKGRLFWLSEKGMMALDMATLDLQNLSEMRINGPNPNDDGEPGIFDYSTTILATAAAGFDHVGNQLRLSVNDDREFIWNFEYYGPDIGVLNAQGETQTKSPSKWTRSQRGYKAYVYVPDLKRFYAGSATDGKIYRESNGITNNGAALSLRWRSKEFDFGNPTLEKEFQYVGIEARSSVFNFRINEYLNFGDIIDSQQFTAPIRSNAWNGRWNGNWGGFGMQSFFESFGQNAVGKTVSFELTGQNGNWNGRWNGFWNSGVSGDSEFFNIWCDYVMEETVVKEVAA